MTWPVREWVRRWGPTLLTTVVVGGAVAHAVVVYTQFMEDDAFISFRYAERLEIGHWLTWTDGQPVEGYSDLLWVLLLAVLHGVFGIDHRWGAPVLGVVGAALAVWSVSVDPETRRPDPVRTLSGGLLLATTGSLAAWAMGGLEQTFLAGLVGLAVLAVVHRAERGGAAVAVGLLLAVIAWVRVDAFVLIAGLFGGGVLATRSVGPWLVVAWPAALALGIQEAHRIWFYGQWEPQTSKVKVSASTVRMWHGVTYVKGALGTHAVLVVAAFAGSFGRWATPRIVVPSCTAVLWVAYLTAVGGDIFVAWRQFVPVLTPLAFLASEAAVRMRPAWRWVVVAIAVAAHVPVANTGRSWAAAHEGRFDRRMGTSGTLGAALKAAWGDRQPLLAVDAAGALPYYTMFPAIDMLGLNDPWLVDHPPPGFGGGAIGHDLGDAAYVWRSEPDVIAFDGGFGSLKPTWRHGRALVRDPKFLRRYQVVQIAVVHHGERLTAQLHVRREGGRLGVERTSDRIVVPGMFAASLGSPAAVLDRDTLVVPLNPGERGVVQRLEVPKGVWTLDTDPSELDVSVECGGESGGPTFGMARSGVVNVVVSGTGKLREITLTAAEADPTLVCLRRP